MKQKADRILVGGFVSILFLMSLAFFLMPKERFSELENRTLQATPQLTWDNLISKTFADQAESFVTDHFPFRADWVWTKSTMEQLRLQQENNGIFRGKDGYLFEKFAEPDYAKLQQYVEAVKQFADSHPDASMTFMLAPTSIGMYPERLPWKAPNYSEAKVNDFIADHLKDGLSFMDGFRFLSPHASEQIYYKTDHHWTTLGAYYAYIAYAEKMGWEPMSQEEFQITNVSESFLGSYHTRSQFSGLTPDTIQTYIPKHPVQTEMYIADTDKTFSNLYDDSFLEKKDQYSYFLGGVHALMTLKSPLDPQAVTTEKLLVVKDSYAHSFLPFLTQHVPEIHVIDIRYYNGSISDYMAQNGIKDVLMLFNTATFVDNGEILKIDD
ncbi:DHHW family protein [Cohnella sp. WQ 127256]|uniref:DHHW family protein n=1 Tax=Cohnella sp. WQ 127256 TaxID=2938790 RepID=UPI002118CD7C|nr:DHHW family protein [Cohnella sp. WQ 127256]